MAYNAQYDDDNPGFVGAGRPVDDRQRGFLQDVAQHAQGLLPGKGNFDELKEELEGPKPLRVIAGLGGLALCLGSALGLINIFTLISHPAQFVLRAYETLFGALIAIIELKAFFKPGNKLRDFCHKWFPFLTIIGGKGAFYLFAGSLGLGFGWTALLVFVPAAFCAGIGVVYILFHFGKCSELRDKYDQTVMFSGEPNNAYV